MEIKIDDKKSAFANLNYFDCYAKENDYIEVTEWFNGEGWDININNKTIQLTDGELEAINFLTKYLNYSKLDDSKK